MAFVFIILLKVAALGEIEVASKLLQDDCSMQVSFLLNLFICY